MSFRALGARTPGRGSATPRRVVLLLVAACAFVAVPLSGARTATSAKPVGSSEAHVVTLVTGDVVRVVERSDGKRSVSLEPDESGSVPEVAISEVGEHLYVMPQRAARLLAAKRLDLDLFDVAALVKLEYDDARRSTIPVIVDYGAGQAAGDEARRAGLVAAEKTVALTSIGAAAFAADKERARAFWRSLTSGADSTGAATALSDGAARVDLDGRVRAALDASVPQIHAPEAWAAGYDGAGTTVAVLDSGYDPTHPDLAGQVSGTANFTSAASVVDGNGHGTHVASTIAGTGAASGGSYRGVAPGADLMIGKVLADDGFGEDSWVLAGMEWAVANGADVVNLSLGGDLSDGTDPLSRAIDDLSAQSDTLFVVAAGNSGSAPSTVTAPGASTAALTVGAVDGTDSMAWFSSRGPRLGDRAVKPEVVAPGVSITAARAAGTSAGSPVNDNYTDIEGTSMATPHVAGLAAIVKDAHPGWGGEQIKSAVAGSTVPVPGATAFDAGTGRIDAARAIAQTVLAEPTLDLGFFPFPQDDLSPRSTPLTYTNPGSSPVDLELSVAAQDPAGEAPAGVTLSASAVTVPAGGQATVDVVLDPSNAASGDSSGVIVADAGGGAQIRTAFGFALESEHYDLTVEIDPRTGTQAATHTLALVGLETFSYEQRTLSGAGSHAVTFRVPPGAYSTGAITFALAGDEALEGVLTYEPLVRVSSDVRVVLDGGEARPFTYETSRPAASDGQIMMVDWGGSAGFAGFLLAGSVDRLFATPLASTDELTVSSSLNWMLSQPAAELTPASGATVPLQMLAAAGQQPWDVPVPQLEGRHLIVDAGSASNLDTSSASQSIALVAGACADLTGAAAALKAAGAIALVAYAGDGAECAGTLEQPAPLPAFQARPYDVARLLSAGGRPEIVTHRGTNYIYDLMGAWPDKVPAGATLDGSAKRVASFIEQYDSLGAPAKDGQEVWDIRIGWVPGRGVAAFGLVRPVPVPSTVTHYASPIAEWERAVEVRSPEGFPQAMLAAPPMTVAAGAKIRDRWFGGPIATNASPLLAAAYGWQSFPYRTGDFLWMVQPTWVDDAGHVGFPIYLGEFEGKLYLDGELQLEATEPIWMQWSVPAEGHDYELVYTTHRQNAFWQRSTTTETRWKFASQTPAGDHEVLPLMRIDYDLALDKLGTAPAGAFRFGVGFGMPPEVATAQTSDVAVEISWDRGASWAPAQVGGCGSNGCTVQVQNRKSASASLRVTASDAAGRSVKQTIVDAYLVR